MCWSFILRLMWAQSLREVWLVMCGIVCLKETSLCQRCADGLLPTLSDLGAPVGLLCSSGDSSGLARHGASVGRARQLREQDRTRTSSIQCVG